MDDANVYVCPRGFRECRTCREQAKRRFNDRRRKPRPTEFQAFLLRIAERPSGCWEWQGALADNGYARMGYNRYAHRYSYEKFKGEIPKGLEIDHVCRNRRCVNPRHLEAVTRSENMKRAYA